MIETWTEGKLGDFVDLITGFPFKSKNYTDNPNDIRLLRGDNIAQQYLRWEKAKFWPKQNTDEYKKYFLQKGDVVLAMDRPWIEAGLKIARVQDKDVPSLLVQRVSRLRGTDRLNSRFLYYVLTNPIFTSYVLGIQTGTGIPHISATQIRDYKFLLPPLDVQEKIAEILGDLDDKIELNRRINETLENIAMALYKHWFVDFGPFQDEGFKDVGNGVLPKSWNACLLKEVVDTFKGGDWGQEVPTDKETISVNVIRGTDFYDIRAGLTTSIPTRYIKESSYKSRNLEVSDIVVENSVNSKTRCIGQNILVTEDILNMIGRNAISASFCKVLRLKDKSLTPLVHLKMKYLYDTGAMEEYQNISSNGIGNFQAKSFAETLLIPIPPENIYNNWLVSTNDILQQIAKNRLNTNTLITTRDYLLSNLLSSEINVESIKKQVEGVL